MHLKPILSAIALLILGGCSASVQSDGRALPPNYYIHQLGLEGGGG